MPDCVFCRIVRGEIPSNRVFEDNAVLALLDAFPLAKGHVLIIPKAHRERLETLTDAEAQAVYMAMHRANAAVMKVLGAPATTLGFNNGRESGQEVPHVHGHIVPRWPNDGGGPFHAIMTRRPQVSKEEMADLAAKIRRALQGP